MSESSKKKASLSTVIDLTRETDVQSVEDDEVHYIKVQQLPAKDLSRKKRTRAADVDVINADRPFKVARTSSRTSIHHPVPARKRTLDCSICIEDDIPAVYGYTLSCQHRFCLPCLSTMIKSNIEGSGTTATCTLECPAPKCTTLPICR
jgi:Zinc finger, C3HC4 type (RING finger)